MSDKKYNVILKAQSYDFKILDLAIREITACLKESNIVFSGPIPMPTKKLNFTLRRATKIYKSSMEKYQKREYRRMIILHDVVTSVLVKSLNRAIIPQAVNVVINVDNKSA